MLPINSKKSWISKKIAYILSKSDPVGTILSVVQTRVKSPGLRSRRRLDCGRELGSMRINIANVRMSGDQNWTIIKGVLKSFLMVYEEALLGNDLEGRGGQYA